MKSKLFSLSKPITQSDSFRGGNILKNYKVCMKTNLTIGLMVGLFVLGTVHAGVSQTTLESTKKEALDLYSKLIPLAQPQVKAKIGDSALAFKKYLTQCSRNCDLYQFFFKDLMSRFTKLTDTQFQLLMALVFAEAVSNMSLQMQRQLWDTMQIENRSYTLISSIMKTNLDTLKGNINNIH